jgi:hypothetical protein
MVCTKPGKLLSTPSGKEFWILDFAESYVGGSADLSKLSKTDFGLIEGLKSKIPQALKT